ncbi:MAG: serine/threonine-protein kinase [Phycisphaerales bacterium]
MTKAPENGNPDHGAQDPNNERTAEFNAHGEGGSDVMFGAGGRSASDALDPIPDEIGPYRVLGLIGRGGMGSVFKATSDRIPGRRTVAIKVVRRGIDTEDVLARFQNERKVLSALSHPNIARFFEAGETRDGRPYFVMEYVEGQAIDQYCDANNLGVKDRLAVFIKVCHAVHHAHTNLIVHRDLKPANILVTPAGEPKLLDFGIAKLTNPEFASVMAMTGPGMRLMTPEYASPEQVRGEAISTLSDVYSLGVMLYELLSGHRPYKIAARVEEELRRVICDTDPDRPSTAISRVEMLSHRDGTTEEITAETIAKRRGIRPDTLRRLLSGDLDDIVMQALTKAPKKRYPSVQEMAEDIRRHIDGEPVGARRARRRGLYVATKFVRRHPRALASTAAALIAIVSLGVWGYSGEVRARAEAERRLREEQLNALQTRFNEIAWEAFRDPRLVEALAVEERNLILEGLVNDVREAVPEELADEFDAQYAIGVALRRFGGTLASRSGKSLGADTQALEILREAEGFLARATESQPENLRARYHLANAKRFIGDALKELGKSEEAFGAYQEAQSLAASIAGDEELAPNFRMLEAASLVGMGQMRVRVCRLDEGFEHYERSLEIRRSLVEQDNSADRRNFWATGLFQIADAHFRANDLIAAEESYRRTLDVRMHLLEEQPESVAVASRLALTRVALAEVLNASGQGAAALEVIEPGVAWLDQRVRGDQTDVTSREQLFWALMAQAEASLAEEDGEGAAAVAELALTVVDGIAEIAPKKASLPRLRAAHALIMARTNFANGDVPGALDGVDRCVRTTEVLLIDSPERAHLRRQLAQALSLRGQVLEAAAGEDSEVRQRALTAYVQASRVYDQMRDEDRLCGVPLVQIQKIAAAIERLRS